MVCVECFVVFFFFFFLRFYEWFGLGLVCFLLV